jgi:hypothetical protein
MYDRYGRAHTINFSQSLHSKFAEYVSYCRQGPAKIKAKRTRVPSCEFLSAKFAGKPKIKNKLDDTWAYAVPGFVAVSPGLSKCVHYRRIAVFFGVHFYRQTPGTYLHHTVSTVRLPDPDLLIFLSTCTSTYGFFL